MTIDTQMTLALLQELMMTLRANNANSYEPLQTHGVENPESDIVVETEPELKVPSQVDIMLFLIKT